MGLNKIHLSIQFVLFQTLPSQTSSEQHPDTTSVTTSRVTLSSTSINEFEFWTHTRLA